LNGAPITTFGCKPDVTDNCRKCGNLDLHDLFIFFLAR